MEEPRVAKKGPYITMLEAGTHYWCSCGLSANQPFCDGSHGGSGFLPVKIEVGEAGYKSLCGCKRTKNPPFCDGSHGRL